MSTYPQNIPPLNQNQNWNQGTSQAANVSYYPVSFIPGPPPQAEDEGDDPGDGIVFPDSSSATVTGASSPQSPRQTARRSFKESQQRSGSYKSAKRPSRIKEKGRKNPRRKSSSSSAKEQRLRSSKAGPNINDWGEDDGEGTDSTKVSKTSHNVVEKHYRTRLNDKFSTLLDALPPDAKGAGGGDSGGSERKLRKGEVLERASSHIQNLERTNMSLEDDKKALQEDVQRLKEAWAGMRGNFMP
jgi:Helix-loop-helix DNA-binding domain